jgi:hypothetical protein
MPERIPLSARDRFEILRRDKFTCRYCGRKSPEVKLHVDHVTPVAEGGTNHPTNLCAACSDCNLGKGADGFETKELFRHWGEPPELNLDVHVQRQRVALKDYLLRRFPDADGTRIQAICSAWVTRCDADLSELIAIALDQASWAEWLFTSGVSFGRQLEVGSLRDELNNGYSERAGRMRAYLDSQAVRLGFREEAPTPAAPAAPVQTSKEVN